jgi:hypothetical protein
MKIRTPIYLVVVVVVCVVQAMANRNGWGLYPGMGGGFRPGGPATRHK